MASVELLAVSGSREQRSGAGRLEALDRVARGVLEQDLTAAPPGDDVVTEAGPTLLQRLDLAREVHDLDLETIPAPGLRTAAIRHRLSGAARVGLIEQQPQVASRKHRKARSGLHLDVKAQMLDVEGYRGVDVVVDVANAGRRHFRPPPPDTLYQELFIAGTVLRGAVLSAGCLENRPALRRPRRGA